MQNSRHYIGLTDKQVLQNRERYGENVLTPQKREPLWKLFLEKFEDPIIKILLIAAFLSLGISFVHMEFAETIGIFFAILLATGVAFWFERDANKKFDVLNKVKDDTLYKIVRNENISEIAKKNIVVGDVLILETGEEVPADGKLLEAVSLQIDESCLTGEPIIDKTTNPDSFNKDATYPSNWVMRGTKIMDGHCIVEVLKVGDETEFGKVAEKSTEMSGEETPLNKQLDKLAKLIGFVGLLLAVLTFIVLLVKDLFLGEIHYPMNAIGLLAVVIIAVTVASAKVWVPIIYDYFEIMGRDKKLPNSIKKGSWFTWLLYGAGSFISLSVIAYIFGVNPLERASWISMETAAHLLQYFMVSVTLIVVAVPEGLPMSVTLSLALSMRRMLQKNNLVRKMHACETMGAATVICTDKTGTLTKNQMQVHKANFWCIKDEQLDEDVNSDIIRESISVNSTAYLDFSNPNKIKTLGNPTEAALLLWLHKQGDNYLKIREQSDIIEQLTFSPERKFMASLVESSLLRRKVLYVKGAPEIILSKCGSILTTDGLKPIEGYLPVIEESLLGFQKQAMRTLGFAYEIVDDTKDRFENGKIVNSNLIFVGFTAIADPLREDVSLAVQKCLDAGIEVKIVTGDTPGTAKEIGKQIGIWKITDKPESIITGSDFAELSDQEAVQRVQQLKLMCRARPTDKQRLVQLLQRNGEIVAVTGDGTNDAPALNHAHVGLSMGSGTSVAKEASDITLLDDSFNSITTAVMWGRSLYQNIQRFILFQLTINVVALVIVFLGSIFGYELPLTVTQMLWVNLIMDTFAAVALASLPPNPDVMENKPRKNEDFIITPKMSSNILFVSFSFIIILLSLLFIFDRNGVITAYDLTRFFTIFVLLQFWNMFNAKAFGTGKSAFYGLHKTVGFLIALVTILLGQFLIVQFGGEVFRTVPLTLRDWTIIFVSTSLVLWIGELVRLIKRIY
ncbi:Ca2+-transporting ATPase [Balneicella halophila]|uniref:P-type Ca(2+) transporter n=1 Tax=Balneicella halophila TaxID=1537566 RepID=A0A7L4UNW9_BALHA|nr:calcium-translocating P-type ATPase, PMCA-type [Balneicella halophila]PVX50798.1 Ca2+-transporting ATPase [Balneicella halophila]